jgi:hypothetical protein
MLMMMITIIAGKGSVLYVVDIVCAKPQSTLQFDRKMNKINNFSFK